METFARRWDATVAWLARHRGALGAVAATLALWAAMVAALWPAAEETSSLCDTPAATVAELREGSPAQIPDAELAAALAEVDAVCDAHTARRLHQEVAQWRATPDDPMSCSEATRGLEELIAANPDPEVSDTELVDASAAAMAALVDACGPDAQAAAADEVAAWMANQGPVLPPELQEGGDTP